MFGGELVGFKILVQPFPTLLDDPGVPDDLLSFGLSGVTEHVFFLEHFPEVCPVSYAVARFPTLEQAEWRAKELNEHSERNPRGYVQYLVQPVEERPKDG